MIHHDIVITRAWLAQIRGIIIFVVLCIAGVSLSDEFPVTILKGKLFDIGSYGVHLYLPVFMLVPFGQLIYLIWKMYDSLYVIDGRGVEMNIGILSPRQKRVKVRFEDIRSIEVDQSIMERILGVGHVLIASAATEGVEIRIDFIANPRELQDLIQTERDKRVKYHRPNETTTRDHLILSD